MNNSSSTKQQQLQLPSLLKPEPLEMQVKQSVRCFLDYLALNMFRLFGFKYFCFERT
jgi:hypothetical protein